MSLFFAGVVAAVVVFLVLAHRFPSKVIRAVDWFADLKG